MQWKPTASIPAHRTVIDGGPRKRAAALALCAAGLLGACSHAPELQRPSPPIPAAWPVALDRDGTVQAAKTHWRAYFPDPHLHALIRSALEYNRDLRIAAGRVLEARAQYGLAQADEKPQLNLFGGGNIARAPSELNTTGTSPISKRFDVTLTAVSFELDFWGRLAGLTEAARASYLATEEARRAVHLSLVADVAGAYFNVLQLDELLGLARSTVALREQSLALVSKGRDLGGADDYVVQQASGVLESARANLALLEHQRVVAANQLNFLTGYAPALPVRGNALDLQGLDVALAPGLPSEVLLLRPDVMAAEQRLVAAHANIAAARAAFLPKVLLTAGLGLASQGLSGLFRGAAWAFQPSITLPLFDGGRLAAGVDVAQARKVIAVAEYEKTIQQAFREVSDLLSARASLVLQLRASAANRDAQEKRLLIAQARFNAGMVGYLEVLDAQREVVTAQQATSQVRRAQLDAAARLYKALGGGADDAA